MILGTDLCLWLFDILGSHQIEQIITRAKKISQVRHMTSLIKQWRPPASDFSVSFFPSHCRRRIYLQLFVAGSKDLEDLTYRHWIRLKRQFSSMPSSDSPSRGYKTPRKHGSTKKMAVVDVVSLFIDCIYLELVETIKVDEEVLTISREFLILWFPKTALLVI